MIRFFVLLVILGIVCSGYSQRDTTKQVRISWGGAQDVLPYILKGYFISGWLGANKLRVRASYANSTIPGFYLTEGIEMDQVNAGGISIEHFIKDNFKGLWFGPGIGYWVNSFETVNRVKGQNNSFVFSLGGGYNITLWKRLYASPWVALHTRFTGVSEKKYGDSKYVPARFTPEVSFKLGWKFGNL